MQNLESDVRLGEEVEHLQRRRIEITNFLQHCGTSIHSLRSLSIKESRHEENCRAIPEGNEDEDEDDEDDKYNDEEEYEDGVENNGNADDDKEDAYDSILKPTLSLLSTSMAS